MRSTSAVFFCHLPFMLLAVEPIPAVLAIPAILSGFSYALRCANLQHLDPHVRHSHGELKVKAKAALGRWPTQAGHARNLLRNGNAFRQHFAEQAVGKHKVDTGIAVHTAVKVVLVPSCGRSTMSRRRVSFALQGSSTVQSCPGSCLCLAGFQTY